jgi:hypothetical protein
VNIDHSKGAIGGTLEDAIRTTMTSDTDLYCRTCKSLREEGKMGRIWLRLVEAPEVLFVRIARFEKTKGGKKYRKCSSEIAVPEILDMNQYLEASDQLATAKAIYRLCGAISHAGTINSGHFVSHVRSQIRRWYRLNDEIVTESSIATLNDDPSKFGKRKFTPYVLAYTKILNGDESADPPLRQHTPPTNPDTKFESTFKLRVSVDIGGQICTLTRKLTGSSPVDHDDDKEIDNDIYNGNDKEDDSGDDKQEIEMQININNAQGQCLMESRKITFDLVKSRKPSGSARRVNGKGKSAGQLSKPPEPQPRTRNGALIPPSTILTRSKNTRPKAEANARVNKA